MPTCPNCKKNVPKLVLAAKTNFANAQAKRCPECAEKYQGRARNVLYLGIALFAVWFLGLIFVVPALAEELAESIFTIYLFSGIIGIPAAIFILNKTMGG